MHSEANNNLFVQSILGETALMYAVYFWKEIAELLAEKGANLDIQNQVCDLLLSLTCSCLSCK